MFVLIYYGYMSYKHHCNSKKMREILTLFLVTRDFYVIVLRTIRLLALIVSIGGSPFDFSY